MTQSAARATSAIPAATYRERRSRHTPRVTIARSACRIHGVANEVAMRRELVVQAAGSVVVQPGVPIEPGPALALHFGHKPADELFANPSRALRGIDE